jgi:hypothetical protein
MTSISQAERGLLERISLQLLEMFLDVFYLASKPSRYFLTSGDNITVNDIFYPPLHIPSLGENKRGDLS